MHPVTGSARLRKPEYDHAAATEGEDLTGLSDVMRVTAEEAGAILMEGFGLPHTLEGKEGREFLTEADLRSQEHIRTRLEGACPGAVFVGEEGACVAIPDGSPFWLVDPLDGTANYAHGFPFFSVSIAFSSDCRSSACVRAKTSSGMPSVVACHACRTATTPAAGPEGWLTMPPPQR